MAITEPFAEEHEAELASFVSQQTTARVALICWEHDRIPTIGKAIANVGNRQYIPSEWPSQRFDLIWRFRWEASSGSYFFSIFPQLLLAHDVHPPDASAS